MNTSPADSELRKKLQEILETEPFGIRAEVVQEAFAHSYDTIADFFSDLLSYGCKSGMIGSLVYYHDTSEFFDKHYQEIEGLRLESEENTGCPLRIESDLKNSLAWFGFEETAYQMAIELELEI